MIIIGICGASGSGKSTLAEEILSQLKVDAIHIHQDSYYKDHPDLTFEERCALNYDEPQIFDHELLLEDLTALKGGRSITRKDYDYADHRRCDSGEVIEPRPAVVCEGIHMFYDRRVRELMDLKIFMQVEPDICLLRRVQRDIKERGRSIDSVVTQYRTTVAPMYRRYIRHYSEYADMIVPEGGKNPVVAKAVCAYITQYAQT